MRISITFRHLEATDAIKDYVNDKVGRIQRYLTGPADAQVVLSTERHLQGCDVTISGSGKTFKSSEVSDDMYASVDRAVDRIERQVQKKKTRTA
jgi:putative sigma-54 modulation protein